MNLTVNVRLLMKALEAGDAQASFLLAIAFNCLEQEVRRRTAEERLRKYGTAGTESLGRFSDQE